ncbi:cAMP-responsive element-binding protein-like 2 isoform X1 [Myotis myotis]|uniref:cAMP-responsive element-binding protein-like 2 isoform X1 n=1 Tax=Myotis myotis TaxID=51298 RepID=UPI00174E032C|nr:cAMP-responsive element-binding protein-like 2 isoform X1 [Myotis myotis]
MKQAGAAMTGRQYLNEQVIGGKVKKPGKRGRKPAKIDLKAKLERSRQSARECRARKKLRYQYLEELVSSRERAICALREELEMYKQWCMAMDQGKIPSEIKALLTGEEQSKSQQNSTRHMKAGKTDANSNSCEYSTWRVSVYVEEGLKGEDHIKC